LFNILQNNFDFDKLKTLDLFGGTGSISYELASRGAKELTVIEKDITMYEFIKKKAANEFGINNMQVIKMDVFKFINQCTENFDLIFAVLLIH
jgi:16S rRNA G966 N2-methylase RsmD